MTRRQYRSLSVQVCYSGKAREYRGRERSKSLLHNGGNLRLGRHLLAGSSSLLLVVVYGELSA